MEWVSMAEQLHASLPSPSPKPSVGWSGVKHTDTGLWSSGNVFCGVMNHPSLFGSQMGEAGFGGRRENFIYNYIYMLLLSQIIQKHNISFHCYADDTQLYLSPKPNDHRNLNSLLDCLENKCWMAQNVLQLNENKSGYIIRLP